MLFGLTSRLHSAFRMQTNFDQVKVFDRLRAAGDCELSARPAQAQQHDSAPRNHRCVLIVDLTDIVVSP